MAKTSILLFVFAVMISCNKTTNITTDQLPAAPAGLTATKGVYNEVYLSWTDNAANETGFMIERRLDTGAYTLLGSTTAGNTTFTDNTVWNNNYYTYRVFACNKSGKSAASSNEVGLEVSSLETGMIYGGGMIAYILMPGDSGYKAGEVHGLIITDKDLSKGLKWGCDSTVTGNTSTALGTGAANTMIITAICGTGSAAGICAQLVSGGYDDWFLPSVAELRKLYKNKQFFNNLSKVYWTSTENNGEFSFAFDLSTSYSNYYPARKNENFAVRAMRYF
jgi:hypothetical protein